MAQSLGLLLFNCRLRKNISPRSNQANHTDHPVSSTPPRNIPPNVTTNTPKPKRSRRKNNQPHDTHGNKTNLPLDTSSVVNLSNVTLTKDSSM